MGSYLNVAAVFIAVVVAVFEAVVCIVLLLVFGVVVVGGWRWGVRWSCTGSQMLVKIL